ncbi:hypothetical protein BDP27DRAFT_1371563 [Rhodocollybia butyracea]|uniref:Uncharacterized protein n=1 Tax=Rhodocollybia butyracea TaxID=206335 RepID=A0A9P5PC16_9AGAR|nr:hypothetical protein BDP27DRAFT_1371563 [Rhodocollybia butyracea]
MSASEFVVLRFRFADDLDFEFDGGGGSVDDLFTEADISRNLLPIKVLPSSFNKSTKIRICEGKGLRGGRNSESRSRKMASGYLCNLRRQPWLFAVLTPCFREFRESRKREGTFVNSGEHGFVGYGWTFRAKMMQLDGVWGECVERVGAAEDDNGVVAGPAALEIAH